MLDKKHKLTGKYFGNAVARKLQIQVPRTAVFHRSRSVLRKPCRAKQSPEDGHVEIINFMQIRCDGVWGQLARTFD